MQKFCVDVQRIGGMSSIDPQASYVDATPTDSGQRRSTHQNQLRTSQKEFPGSTPSSYRRTFPGSSRPAAALPDLSRSSTDSLTADSTTREMNRATALLISTATQVLHGKPRSVCARLCFRNSTQVPM